LKPPLNYFKQKRPTNLIGNVLNVNLKLHNSEIGLDILQKCKILFKFRKPGPLGLRLVDPTARRARSELTGYAEEKCRGMMEYWNVGIMGSEG
jgi:hypothetical protein